MDHSYLFTLRHRVDKITIDAYMDMTDWKVNLAKDKILAVDGFAKKVYHDLFGMSLRLRFNTDMTGPYIVHFPEPLSWTQLEKYINAMPKDHLQRFLQEARIKMGF